MFCIQCGKQLPDGAKFCASCGAQQNPESGAAPVKEQETPRTPGVDVGQMFSNNFGSAQQKPQPKKKKLSAKLKGMLIAVLAFVVAVGIRVAIRSGVEGFFGFVDDSIKEYQSKTYEELDTLMSNLDLVVTGYNRDYWSEDGKSGPLIQVLMKNNSGKTVTSVKVAIATWDKYGYETHLTLDDGEYNPSNVTYLDLPYCIWPTDTVYDQKGLALSNSSEIPERIQAIPVSWTYSDGEKGSNPYAEDWLYKYENKINTRSDLSEIQFPQDLVMSEADLLAALLKQPLVTTNYELAQWDEGDLLCATVTNNSDSTIKNIHIAYATWDADNKPVCITGMNGVQKPSNIIQVQMKDLSVAPGQSYGAENGAALHKDSAKVAKFIAIPYRYEDTAGNVWENPYYGAWLNLYEGK